MTEDADRTVPAPIEDDVYAKAAEYLRSTFAWSNAPKEAIEAARNAFVAGYEQAEEDIRTNEGVTADGPELVAEPTPMPDRAPRVRGTADLMAKCRQNPVTALLSMCGLTSEQAVPFLSANGVKCSQATIKAWMRGAYNPPDGAVTMLWELFLHVAEPVLGKRTDRIPVEIPDSALKRRAALQAMHEWHSRRKPVT